MVDVPEVRGSLMFLREACKHGRYDGHLGGPGPCPGGRILTNPEALGTLLFDVCGECKSSPVKGRVWRSINTPMDAHYYPCPVCGGSGRVPKDGVLIGRSWLHHRESNPADFGEWVAFPASMLEGESE
jgi:hypothetical protein